MTLKDEFIQSYERSIFEFKVVTKMVIAVRLPTGATELIINTEDIEKKFTYYLEAYNDDMQLKNNNDVQVVGCLFV